MTIYKNQFRAIMRKYIGNKGYSSTDGGLTWVESGTPEELIKKLAYYKVVS
jgi:hypothetical protein|nr:MAG TPA: BNR/Asp-box repeat protein [Caudoviricetes sp.]